MSSAEAAAPNRQRRSGGAEPAAPKRTRLLCNRSIYYCLLKLYIMYIHIIYTI